MAAKKNLVIVESPAKARMISKFLGKDYDVQASMGHVRDLPKSVMGVDAEKDFEPKYIISQDKKKVIKDLKSKIGVKTTVWMATDEDREGEAIAWHLKEALKLTNKDIKRIVFHEITKPAILAAIESPRDIDQKLVDAQQARRVLDRLVGYELSPLLWKKIRYGLSAGRVQSVAVRLIVDREREIEAFKPDEFWKIAVLCDHKNGEFEAFLAEKNGKKYEPKNEKDAKTASAAIKKTDLKIAGIEKKKHTKNPAAPFTTSTLQQEAARKLHMSVKKTMTLAQHLYEGGHEDHGLITYMRTDSVNLAGSALSQIKEVIDRDFGKKYSLDTPRVYKSKKGAQEAHEAIRPVDLRIKPEDVKSVLDKDHYRLYKLIWERTIACQMANAVLDRTTISIEAQEYTLKAHGQTVEFDGFMKVYVEGCDNKKDGEDEGDRILPEVFEGDPVKAKKIDPTQHFTKPPPRYTEASLVKKMESLEIGRPSTYAPTIATVQARGYIERNESRQLQPHDIGKVVTDLLVKHFPDIVDYDFTAEMEDDLDRIADGEKEWVPILKAFYKPFHKLVEEKMKSIKKEDVQEKTDEKCEECGAPMVIKFGRFGKFMSCSKFPECKNAKPMGEDEEKQKELEGMEKKFKGKKCKKCGEPMDVKVGRYGPFLACSGYPKCKNIEGIVNLAGVHCPECKDGQLVERRTKKGGRVFWGCNKFPKCKFASWDKPLKEKCEKCGYLMVERGKEAEKKCVKCDVSKK
ncbi:type I DNA topoisomerase [Patescibacteria group bacterium]|nr:type I DNA topoisomerase [Patescibacteria group bacterium]